MTGSMPVNQIRAGKNSSGITLLELMVALFICSLLFVLLFAVYGSFVKVSNFQKSSLDLETQFMHAVRVIEKDVRLAGFGIPGNGLYPINGGAQNFRLVVLSNEDNKKTALFEDAHNGDSDIKVQNADGIAANQWAYMVQQTDVAYYAIDRVGLHSGSDTVFLKDSLIHITWNKSSTQVYFAKGIRYGVELKDGKKNLIRASLMNSIPVGSSIDSFIVCPKDKAGADLGGDYAPAKILGITIGGHVGAAGKTFAATKSFDVDLKNSN